MTPREFKAWFDGFTEAFTGTPTKAQWARIKNRVGEIDGKEVTERIYVDRYWPTYYPYYSTYWPYHGSISGTSGGTGVGGAVSIYNTKGLQCSNTMGQPSSYNSLTAMNALGKAEAQSLSQ